MGEIGETGNVGKIGKRSRVASREKLSASL